MLHYLACTADIEQDQSWVRSLEALQKFYDCTLPEEPIGSKLGGHWLCFLFNSVATAIKWTSNSLLQLDCQLKEVIDSIHSDPCEISDGCISSSKKTASACQQLSIKLGLLGATLAGISKQKTLVKQTSNAVVTASTMERENPKTKDSRNFVLRKELSFRVLPIGGALVRGFH